MVKKVNVGMLGYGFVQSFFHMPCYKEIPQANVVAVGGRSKEALVEFAHRWRIKKTYFGDDFIEKLCADSRVDVVDIGLPNFLHERAAKVASENGKHVICEKPLARSVGEAKAMLNAVEKAKVINCYAENQIFIPHIVKAKELIENDVIGNLFWVRSREAHFGPHSAWFLDPELAGGGVLIDMGCHSIEVARYLSGGKPIQAYGWGATVVHKTKAEDNSLALVKYEDDKLSQSENSWAAHGGLDLRFEIYGSDGSIFIDPTRETGVKVFTIAPEQKVGYIVEKAEAKRGWLYPVWREHEVYGYLFELQHFVTCLLNGEMPKETFIDGYIVNCIIDACYRSMKCGEWKHIHLT
ncbi:MAG: Gfo/Idh/MocA family oxidoreductase [Candidatus Bathyarchaeota archaeon]|nr:Gfo/Idh/MocA family oxidoreductase [Candidatus Bathyarchaeota archaeon]MDH5701646.1 Gfo/Idh/MocA family oxidoreductase [Candidatus Bathyarchaeota archaeon]